MVEGEGKKESEEDKIKEDKADQQLIIFQANKRFTRYINGHPKRHLLTTGWNAFATAKRLLANDSFVFLRGEDGELRVGVRRVSHQQNIMPASVISPQNMHLGVLATVSEALSRKSIFVVHYKPCNYQDG